MSVVVIGAGIVGLTTAYHIKALLPDIKVTVIADKFNTETTSDGAAGLFLPASNFRGPSPSSAKDWMIYSYKFYESLLQEDCGIFETSGYLLSSQRKEDVENDLMVGVAPEYRDATQEELAQFGKWKYGTFMRSLMIPCRIFLPWLMERLKLKNVQVLKKTILALNELSGQYDIVVNCTGLESRTLCKDIGVAPIRGQLVKVKSPTSQFLFADGPDTYIIPQSNGIVALGGTCQYNVWDTRVRQHDSVGIRSRCSALIPSLAEAPLVSEWVGLRPFRGTVRVEAEKTADLKIVHNYGHGGYGVTSAPGTARDAAELVRQLLVDIITSQ